jgi:hypothetical protein
MVKHYFPEGGDYFPASFITNIKTSDQKTTSWTKSTKDLSPENCGELITKYILDTVPEK